MMKDFTNRHRDLSASTDDFFAVAEEHFSRTYVGSRMSAKDLKWFLGQWVHGTALPTYRLEYRLADQPDGSCQLTGTLFQDNVPENFFMVLPVVASFGKESSGRVNVPVQGPSAAINIRLPKRPSQVVLDPESWILSERTTTRQAR
jgi:hypothetical protein